MDYYYIYISDEQYQIAWKNGICAQTVRYRIYNLRWDLKRAITTPTRRLKNRIYSAN